MLSLIPSALARVSLVNWTSNSCVIEERKGEKEGRRNEEQDGRGERKERERVKWF